MCHAWKFIAVSSIILKHYISYFPFPPFKPFLLFCGNYYFPVTSKHRESPLTSSITLAHLVGLQAVCKQAAGMRKWKKRKIFSWCRRKLSCKKKHLHKDRVQKTHFASCIYASSASILNLKIFLMIFFAHQNKRGRRWIEIYSNLRYFTKEGKPFVWLQKETLCNFENYLWLQLNSLFLSFLLLHDYDQKFT